MGHTRFLPPVRVPFPRLRTVNLSGGADIADLRMRDLCTFNAPLLEEVSVKPNEVPTSHFELDSLLEAIFARHPKLDKFELFPLDDGELNFAYSFSGRDKPTRRCTFAPPRYPLLASSSLNIEPWEFRTPGPDPMVDARMVHAVSEIDKTIDCLERWRNRAVATNDRYDIMRIMHVLYYAALQRMEQET
ncbi:hypothetical protein JCM10908_002271 [Rhodotorula pacifica]|uniref:uncharacterized protein n=1 Tax=Rhodotorula pacifica TaxID=1495444 RepID=UPI00317BDCC7